MQGVAKWRYIRTSSADRFRRNVVEMSEMAEVRACNVDGTGSFTMDTNIFKLHSSTLFLVGVLPLIQ